MALPALNSSSANDVTNAVVIRSRLRCSSYRWNRPLNPTTEIRPKRALGADCGATAMVWSAVTGNVGQRNGGFQRHRTGAFGRVQTSDLSLRIDHTKHRHSGSQSRQRSTRHLQSESDGPCTGCVPTLHAGAFGVTRRVAGFHDFYLCMRARHKPASP